MKKLNVILASLVLFSGVSFAQQKATPVVKAKPTQSTNTTKSVPVKKTPVAVKTSAPVAKPAATNTTK
jgi:hypothetical protein